MREGMLIAYYYYLLHYFERAIVKIENNMVSGSLVAQYSAADQLLKERFVRREITSWLEATKNR